jgi:preprotein translocase subunit SecA
MTGTADTEAQEFHDIYKLDVVAIPTNRPVRRTDFEDVVFLSGKDKLNHIVDEIKAFHDAGRPILVGTTSVEKSERISRMLTEKHGVQHEVLNAKQHEREAHIVENAGQLGAVMIATNMAGRGTDIKLGRLTRQQLLDHWLRRNLAPRTLTTDMDDAQLREHVYRKIAPRELDIDKAETEKLPASEVELRLLRAWAHKNTWMSEKDVERADAEELRAELDKKGRFMLHRLRWFESIEEMGGLHVIGTERHEARRIDNQLRGRSGRQGDKGSSRFFVALDDDLMKMFAGETTMKILATMGMKEGDAIESGMLSKRIEGAQRKVEERNFQYRKNILEYDEVMEHQRRFFYGMRQRVLEGRGVRELVFEFIRDTVDDAVEKYLDPDYPAQCAAEYAKARLDCSITADRLRGKELDELEAAIRDEAQYESRQAISLTLGEYMPSAGSDVAIDFDAAGLTNWARNRFGVELDASRLQHGSDDERAYVRDMLVEAAEERISAADLSGLSDFVQKDYGPRELSRWLADKLGFEVSAEQINEARKRLAERSRNEENLPHPVTQLIMDQADEWYRKREVEYPIEYGLQVFQAMSRQPNSNAPSVFLDWANTRFGMGWTPELFKTSTMQAAQKQLLDASFRQLESKQMEREIVEALACKTDEALAAYFRQTYGKEMPEKMRHLSGEEREQAIRARVENMRRFEMLHFERTIMLETLDGAWKDHLHTMDQLRDTINFRAFSQNDPRIEYKREGSHLFRDMLVNAKSRVTEYVFRARVGYRPPAAMPATRPAMQPRSSTVGAGRGVVSLQMGSSGIVGPGGAPGSSSDML